MSEYDINNVMKMAGYTDLGQTLSPALTDEKYLKMIEIRKKYQEWKQKRYMMTDCPFDQGYLQLMEEIIEGYNEFCTGIVQAIDGHCREIDKNLQREKKEFEEMRERIPQMAEEMREVMDKMFNNDGL